MLRNIHSGGYSNAYSISVLDSQVIWLCWKSFDGVDQPKITFLLVVGGQLWVEWSPVSQSPYRGKALGEIAVVRPRMVLDCCQRGPEDSGLDSRLDPCELQLQISLPPL